MPGSTVYAGGGGGGEACLLEGSKALQSRLEKGRETGLLGGCQTLQSILGGRAGLPLGREVRSDEVMKPAAE